MSKKSDEANGIDRGDKTRKKFHPVGNQKNSVEKIESDIAAAIGLPREDVEVSVFYWD